MAPYPVDISYEDTAKGGRYFMMMPNGELSRCSFVRVGPGRIIADSTFVPMPYRGHGIAEQMVEKLVTDARARGDKVSATCWFVADEFERKRPEWDDVKA